MGKTEKKRKDNHAKKTKRQKYGMNETRVKKLAIFTVTRNALGARKPHSEQLNGLKSSWTTEKCARIWSFLTVL